MDAQEVIRQTKEVLKIGELRKTINNTKFLYHTKYDIYDEIVKLDKNKLSICKQGGGFVKSIDITDQDFLNDVDKGNIKFVHEVPPQFEIINVFHDHWNDQYIRAYVNLRHRWNGWFCPLVELSQIKRFNTIQKHNGCKEDTDLFKIINDNQISIIDFNDKEEIIIDSEDFNLFKHHNGKKIKVFDISLGWTWSGERIEK